MPLSPILDQRTVCCQASSVTRRSVSAQVCPTWSRPSTWWSRESGSFGGRCGRPQRWTCPGREMTLETMPVARPVVDLSLNCEKLARQQKITRPSHTCTFFLPLSPTSFQVLHTPPFGVVPRELKMCGSFRMEAQEPLSSEKLWNPQGRGGHVSPSRCQRDPSSC